MIERTIATTTHGRFLIEPPKTASAAPMLVGFHGYGETAESLMERLRAIPSADDWRIVSVQGLHRFYQQRTNEVIASWMTRQDRELAIADNLAYVSAVVEEVVREWPVTRIVFVGFSQGVATAFRAAAASSRRLAGVIAVGGDVPPEIDAPALANLGRCLSAGAGVTGGMGRRSSKTICVGSARQTSVSNRSNSKVGMSGPRTSLPPRTAFFAG